jgi:nitrogen fixation NifU-like protein
MSELRELYQELIVDHARAPRNFGKLAEANHSKEGYNPLCGDKVTVYLKEHDNVIIDVRFEGCGCAISMASASLMTDALKGKKYAEADLLFAAFHKMVTGQTQEINALCAGKLAALAGVAEYPSRVKCATLAWHTAQAAIHESSEVE